MDRYNFIPNFTSIFKEDLKNYILLNEAMDINTEK